MQTLEEAAVERLSMASFVPLMGKSEEYQNWTGRAATNSCFVAFGYAGKVGQSGQSGTSCMRRQAWTDSAALSCSVMLLTQEPAAPKTADLSCLVMLLTQEPAAHKTAAV